MRVPVPRASGAAAVSPVASSPRPRHAHGIVDVTSGNNTVAFRQDGKLYTVQGYPARKGYDLVTGVGTVNAPYLVHELAGR